MLPDSRPFGFNLIGHASANAGLGVTLRNLAKTILDCDYPLAILDVDPGHGRAGHDLSLAPYFVKTAKDLPFGINISTLSITSLPDFIFDYPELFTEETLNVGYFWWELSALPEQWVKSLEIFDVLLAGSDFLYSTYSRLIADVFHVKIVHDLALPPDIKADRAKFGIKDDAFALVCILEPTSDPIRKNPYAVIEAFQKAFPDDKKAHLIIKINNVSAFSVDDVNLKLLLNAAATDQRIRLLTKSLSYIDVLSLYKSCDVYVALHRAEGLGLGLIEAMLLGKPVIATSWSGNMSFMDHTNSCLTRYKLVEVEGSLEVYKTAFLGYPAYWAEPNIEDAANWMKMLSSDKDMCLKIGEMARTALTHHLRKEVTSKWIEELMLIWERAHIFAPTIDVEKSWKTDALKKCLVYRNKSQWQIFWFNFMAFLNRHLLWRFRKSKNV